MRPPALAAGTPISEAAPGLPRPTEGLPRRHMRPTESDLQPDDTATRPAGRRPHASLARATIVAIAAGLPIAEHRWRGSDWRRPGSGRARCGRRGWRVPRRK